MSEAKDKSLVPISEMPVTMRTFETLASLPTTPERYRNKPMDMWAAALQGRELGMGPISSINNIFLVNGQTSMYAKAMAANIFSRGHIYKLKAGDELAEITCYRYQPQLNELIEVGQLMFSMEDAIRAGLPKQNKRNWDKYPQMMLANRVLSWATRMFYADCLVGVGYTPEEIDLRDDEAMDVIIDEVPEDDDHDTIAEGEVIDEA